MHLKERLIHKLILYRFLHFKGKSPYLVSNRMRFKIHVAIERDKKFAHTGHSHVRAVRVVSSLFWHLPIKFIYNFKSFLGCKV